MRIGYYDNLFTGMSMEKLHHCHWRQVFGLELKLGSWQWHFCRGLLLLQRTEVCHLISWWWLECQAGLLWTTCQCFWVRTLLCGRLGSAWALLYAAWLRTVRWHGAVHQGQARTVCRGLDRHVRTLSVREVVVEDATTGVELGVWFSICSAEMWYSMEMKSYRSFENGNWC